LQKPFKFPFWSLVVLAVLITAYNILANAMSESRVSLSSARSQLFILVIVDAVLLAEASFYWLNRGRIKKHWWAIMHNILLYIVFIVLPVISWFDHFYFSRNYSQVEYIERMIRFQRITPYIVWPSLILAHIFFIATIVKTLRTKKPQQADASDTTNILDDFSG